MCNQLDRGDPLSRGVQGLVKDQEESSKYSEKAITSRPNDTLLVRMGVTVLAQVPANPKDTHFQATEVTGDREDSSFPVQPEDNMSTCWPTGPSQCQP